MPTRMSFAGRSGRRSTLTALTVLAGASLLVTACAPVAETDTGGGDGAAPSNAVTIVVHNSFPNEEFAQLASEATGYEVSVVSAGDGGELTNQLVLTQGAPIADAFFGVDNNFASRLVAHEVVEPYRPAALAERAEQHLYDDAGSLVPITIGATCINIDPAWFAERDIVEPQSYEDLADARYEGLTVLLDPASSSTGASFLIGTVAEYGVDGFADYWSRLAANNPRLETGWSEAYNGHFTQGGGDGTYPIVVSYSSSPAWTLSADGSSSTTKALLDTCSSQIEYAGVLQGAQNPEGARAVIDFMLSADFQDTIAESMYMYPIDADRYVPEEWQEFAPMPDSANDMTPAEIGEGREAWLRTWAEATGW